LEHIGAQKVENHVGCDFELWDSLFIPINRVGHICLAVFEEVFKRGGAVFEFGLVEAIKNVVFVLL